MKKEASLIAVISLLAVFACSGCATMQKARRADELELENLDLRAKLSEVEQSKAEEIMRLEQETEEMRGRIAKLEEEREEAFASSQREKKLAQIELEEAKRNLEQALAREIEEYKAKLQMTERGLVVTFLSEVFFDSGKADIKDEGFSALDSVAKILVENVPDSPIAIEGHTDNEPIIYSGWKSNWELSSARALAVLHYFIDKRGIEPGRLMAAGYGEYKPVESNETAEGRQKNRRVEVVILPKSIQKVKSEPAQPVRRQEGETAEPEEFPPAEK